MNQAIIENKKAIVSEIAQKMKESEFNCSCRIPWTKRCGSNSAT